MPELVRDRERSETTLDRRLAATALLVAAAYYVGANVGLILRFPPTTPSVLWPPNSILTATLLLWPARRWWVFLLAVLPAHLAAELPAGWPLGLVLALYVTNCLEAVIAASLVRRFSDDPTRFDTLRRAAVFMLAAGVAAPLISSCVDATAVWLARGEPYAHVFVTRLSSNVLTALTLVPAIVTVVTGMPAWLRRASVGRRVEAASLALGLCGITLLIFGFRGVGSESIPGAPVTPMIFLLPFMLWAAVRFGPAGTSLALLTTAILASWAATYGTGPFHGLPAGESVLALQMSLVVVAIPMLCLAALIEERRRAEGALVERLGFEELLSHLSGAFVHLTSAEMSRAFERWLEQVGQFLGLTRMTLSLTGYAASATSSWTAGDARRRDGESSVTLPLAAGERVLGSLCFAKLPANDAWSDELHQRLHLIAEVFANALARKGGEDALRASEVMKSAILASLSSGVAVLDRAGWIIAVNDTWMRFAPASAGSATALGVGDNYLDACREAARLREPHADELLAGVCAVLAHARPGFTVEYARAGGREHWFALSVVPLHRPEGGAVVSQTEITERKHAEMEAQQTRQELAHFTRVSTMGELTASLAHELNQPLTGILINAQTARRFLDADPPAVGDLREILGDIIDDDTRAAEVIRRLRDLLRKSDPERVRLDLNVLVRDVIRLLGSDAIIRNVTLTLDCAADPAMVHGDRIQLQQVVLNLLLNAMEAVADGAAADRRVTVRTARTGDAIQVSVRDAGPGLREGASELVFEPFYTTKPSGMGMGLSIVRSIIRMHDGAITAANNPTGGTTFSFELPSADLAAA